MNEKERAAMEQALEALEYENSWHESFKVRPYASTIDAVAALRAALAQPVQEPVSKMTTHRAIYFMERFKREEKLLGPNEQAALDFVISMLEKQAEPVEPVGQILPNWSTEKECIDGICAYLNDLGKNLPVNTLLYTAPPQREQVLLTDEEIDALPWNGSPRQFARAVEKAFLEKNK